MDNARGGSDRNTAAASVELTSTGGSRAGNLTRASVSTFMKIALFLVVSFALTCFCQQFLPCKRRRSVQTREARRCLSRSVKYVLIHNLRGVLQKQFYNSSKRSACLHKLSSRRVMSAPPLFLSTWSGPSGPLIRPGTIRAEKADTGPSPVPRARFDPLLQLGRLAVVGMRGDQPRSRLDVHSCFHHKLQLAALTKHRRRIRTVRRSGSAFASSTMNAPREICPCVS
jgi:hypothetical protein